MDIETYKILFSSYGKQKWWPMKNGFVPKKWEICVGAILTQNTLWSSVERALSNMKNSGCVSPHDILKIKKERLESIIKPSGFFRQKAERLKILSKFVLDYGSFEKFTKKIQRDELLRVKGIGPETCDSILLYACNKPYFVIDSYTRRLCERLGLNPRIPYENLREVFERNLPNDIEIYKEFHALIVRAGKDGFSVLVQ